MEVQTVAVIFNRNGLLNTCYTFSTDEEGVRQAEKQFLDIARDYYWEGDELTPEEGLEHGYWESKSGTDVSITWT